MAASMSSRTISEGSDENEAELLQELGLLEAIYIDELNVVHNDSGAPCELSIVLHPATAGNVDQQYVCLTLHLTLPQRYPVSLPEIAIRNSRGVSDEHLTSLDARLKLLATERQGQAMLYELIEVAKESLTNNNTPSCQCVICLHGFTEADVFSKTQCYHYFHSQCLARYIRHAQDNEEESVCPVCREPVTFDLPQLDKAPPPRATQAVYKPDKLIRDMQRAMGALYRRQKEKGGIIDIEAESNKYLINISQTPNLPRNVGISPALSQSQSQPTTEPKAGTPSLREEWRPIAEPGKLSDSKDTDGGRERQAEQTRAPPRGDSKRGGRVWARGRGSGGRGHHQRRPQPSGVGGHEPPTTGSGSGGRREARGPSRNGGPSGPGDGERSANRSRPQAHAATGHTRAERLRETEVRLDNGLSEGPRPASKTVPVNRPKSRSQGKPDRQPQEALRNSTTDADGVAKSGEPRQLKRTKETVRKEPDRAAPNASAEISDGGRRRTARGDGAVRGQSRRPEGEPDPRPDDRRTSSGQRNSHESPGAVLQSSEARTGKGSDQKRPAGAAAGSRTDEPAGTGAAAKQEGGRQQPRHRNRRRGGEPGPSKDGGGAREVGGPRQRPRAGTNDGDRGAKQPSEGSPRHQQGSQRAPPPTGFGAAVTGNETGGSRPKPVRPPPGFEKLVL